MCEKDHEAILTRLDSGNPLPDLAGLGEEVDRFTRDLLADGADLTRVLDTISHIHDTLTRRIISHHLEKLEAETPLPCPFCWISMGSDARGEQVIRTDQDNALIFADTPEPAVADAFFKALAGRVTQDLDRFGFTYCKGEVMAVNPVWRRSLSQWLRVLDRWVGSAEPEDVRKLTILLDFRPVFGEQALADRLHSRVFELFKTHGAVSHYLVRDDKLFAAPRTFLGRTRTKKLKGCRACFNIKTAALAHLINGIRLLALNNGITSPSTLERMQALADLGVIGGAQHRELAGAFLYLNRLKISARFNKDRAGDLPANHIDLALLSPDQRQALETALDAVETLQKRIHRTYNVAWMNFFN